MCKEASEAANDHEALDFVRQGENAQSEHREPLEKFGRYPHRNECLGRRSTADEAEYLKTAKTFGVEQGNKEDEGKE